MGLSIQKLKKFNNGAFSSNEEVLLAEVVRITASATIPSPLPITALISTIPSHRDNLSPVPVAYLSDRLATISPAAAYQKMIQSRAVIPETVE
jgi:hypothetical protein